MLISLLNAILRWKPTIKDIKLDSNELPKILKNNKTCRLDIAATSDEGIKFDIEIQCQKTKGLFLKFIVKSCEKKNKKIKSATLASFFIDK